MHQAHPSRQFVDTLQTLGMPNAIKNVDTAIDLIPVDDEPVPITINESEYTNSYVCSPYTAYILYAEEELGLIKSSTQRAALKVAIKAADKILKVAKINRTLSINNWLVSTNITPNWSAQTIQNLTTLLLRRYPNHSYSIRSLNETHHAELMQHLKQAGWHLVPARQVYLFDNKQRQWWKRSHTKRDQSLLRKTKLIKVSPEMHCQEDFVDIYQCFYKLFIEKHSIYNPQFSAEFLHAMHQSGLMEFHSFRDPTDHRIIASIALFTQQNIITTPIVGYDTSMPKELGLYRLLMAVLLKQTYNSGKAMNLSSGAGSFKRARGGKAALEYTAFYCKHLPFVQRIMMTVFAKTLNLFAPKVFQNNEI